MILPSGSMTFSSNSFDAIYCNLNHNLEEIESGAFQGKISDTN